MGKYVWYLAVVERAGKPLPTLINRTKLRMLAVDCKGNDVACPHVDEFMKRPSQWVGRLLEEKRPNKNPALSVGKVILPEVRSGEFELWALKHDFEDFSDDPEEKGTSFDEFIVFDVKQGRYHHLVQMTLLNYESDDSESGFQDTRAVMRKAKLTPQHRYGIGFDRNASWPTFQGVPMEYVTQFVLPARVDEHRVPGSVCVFLFWAEDEGRDVFKAYARMLGEQTIEQHYADERKRGLR